MNLSLLILLPLITAIGVLLARNAQQVKLISLVGSVIQFVFAIVLFFTYRSARLEGDTEQMLFMERYSWFPPLNIEYFIGVDGISVAMIILTGFVVLAGVLVSWNVEKMTKE